MVHALLTEAMLMAFIVVLGLHDIIELLLCQPSWRFSESLELIQLSKSNFGFVHLKLPNVLCYMQNG
jgi:hypothetical protein